MKFEDWLSAQMKQRSWSQAQLARESGVSRQTISYWFSGKSKKPDQESLQKIADALGLPVEEVYRAAGILPGVSNKEKLAQQILKELEDLPEEEQEGIVDYIRYVVKGRNRKA